MLFQQSAQPTLPSASRYCHRPEPFPLTPDQPVHAPLSEPQADDTPGLPPGTKHPGDNDDDLTDQPIEIARAFAASTH